MKSVYDTYYEIIEDNNLLFESDENKILRAKYKFKFKALPGADGLNPAGKKALNNIKNIVESSDNGKLQDLVNLKIEEYLGEIEKSFGNIENDKKETNDDDDVENSPDEKTNDEDDELAEDSPDEKTNDEDDELAE
jgi:hypothetical protein